LHNNLREELNALSGIRNRNPSTDQSQTYALDCTPLGMSEKSFALRKSEAS